MIKMDQKSRHPRRALDLTIEDHRRVITNLDGGGNLGEEPLQRLAESCTAFDFRRRRFIYRAGDPADSLFVIAHGRIKLCRIEENSGREAVIDILSKGSLF